MNFQRLIILNHLNFDSNFENAESFYSFKTKLNHFFSIQISSKDLIKYLAFPSAFSVSVFVCLFVCSVFSLSLHYS